ncbi:putative F-box protein At5g55150 [Nicotiana tomentosiformis]|uniref:putative F-box protein At5g55150 n=1 Tax=Nicotiana tomentosiformis TaxID=4098 RepID=UPI00051C7B4A|nr:F-box protein SKIP23-like [Nicotiana tomentosiformis]
MAQIQQDLLVDWSELQHDLLVLIARRLNLIEDYLSFGTVCKSWHVVVVATKCNFNSDLPRVPWLMLAEEDQEDDKSCCRKFFSLYNSMILKKRIPKATGKRCIESMGWLITVGEDDGEISLLHPFSGVEIELPHQKDYHDHHWMRTSIRKAVLSASPSHTSHYVLMVIEVKFLRFWRSGDLRWTKIKWEEGTHFPYSDIVYFNGHFYALDFTGRIVVCDVTGPEPTKSHVVAQLPFYLGQIRGQTYILESLGSLFVVVRNGCQLRLPKDDFDRIPLTFIQQVENEEYLTYGTLEFIVYRVDLAAGQGTQTRELGGTAFFLGASASLSVQASQFPGIKPNHIYFTDDFLESYIFYEEGGGLDMGVFNLADGSIQPHYEGVSLSRFCPPIWVTPTLS